MSVPKLILFLIHKYTDYANMYVHMCKHVYVQSFLFYSVFSSKAWINVKIRLSNLPHPDVNLVLSYNEQIAFNLLCFFFFLKFCV